MALQSPLASLRKSEKAFSQKPSFGAGLSCGVRGAASEAWAPLDFILNVMEAMSREGGVVYVEMVTLTTRVAIENPCGRLLCR